MPPDKSQKILFFVVVCFLMWTILKVFIEFVTILLLSYILVFCLTFYFFGLEAWGMLAP